MSYVEQLFSVAGKTALITGAATGIGRMAATALVHAGANVLIASRKGADCARVADELNAMGATGTAKGFAGDVSSEEGVAALVGEVKARADSLNILMNNAGVSWGAPLEQFPYSAWAKLLNVNVTGLFHLTRELLPLLERAASHDDPARVINLGSVMGTQPLADDAYSYTASKAAGHHLARPRGSAEPRPRGLPRRLHSPPRRRRPRASTAAPAPPPRLRARPLPEPHDGLRHG